MSQTPEDLIPRMGNLPISNARYFQRAVITKVSEPEPEPDVFPRWEEFGRFSQGHEITDIAFSPDGSKLAVADTSGVIKIWNASTLEFLQQEYKTHHGRAIASVAFHPSGSRLAYLDIPEEVGLWSLETEEIEILSIKSTLEAGIGFDENGRLLARPAGEDFGLFDLTDGSRVESLMPAQDGEFTATEVQLNTRKQWTIGGSGDGSVGFWQKGQFSVVQGIGRQEGGTVTAVAMHPSGEFGISGGLEGNIRFWLSRTGEAIALDHAPAHNRTIRDLEFNRKGTFFASAGDDGVVALWREDGSPMIQFGGVFDFGWDPVSLLDPNRDGDPDNLRRFTSVAISPDSQIVVAGGSDGEVFAWIDTTHYITQPVTLPLSTQQEGVESRPAEGVLLTHRQSWTMEGVALGPLLHSVCLAPGEITQLAMTSHTQSVFENSADTVSQQEALSQSGRSSSFLSESELASADETSSGFAIGASSSSTVGGGVSFFGGSYGAAHSGAVATTVSYASGTRHVADAANQSVHESAADSARLSRNRFSASVREVSESDSVELKTRVIANYNHMHALTLQYYEVLQVQRLTTVVIDAERLIFVPMRMIAFANPDDFNKALNRFPHEIADTVRELGFTGAATCIDHLLLGFEGGTELRQHRVDKIWQDVNETRANLHRIIRSTGEDKPSEITKARERVIATSDSVLRARDSLRKFTQQQRQEQLESTRSIEDNNQKADAAADSPLADRAVLQRHLNTAILAANRAKERYHQLQSEVSDLRKKLAAVVRLQSEIAHLIGENVPLNEPNVSPSAPRLDPTKLGKVKTRVHEILIENELEVNQGLWFRLDPSIYATLLEGTLFEGESISATVNPTPVAVTGDRVGFRWSHSDEHEAALFRHRYVSESTLYQESITLPSGGVFCEGVLGESNVADVIDIRHFWNWTDSLPPIRPTEIDPLRQPESEPLQAPTLPLTPEAQINLSPISFPEVASSIPNVLDALKNPELFQDLSGTKVAAALAQSAMALTQSNATEAATLASENYKRYLQLQQKIASSALEAIGSPEGKEFDPTMAGAILNANGPVSKSETTGEKEFDNSNLPAPGDDSVFTDPADELIVSFEVHEPAPGIPSGLENDEDV